MALDQDKIIKNTKKYFDTATKLGFMNDGFMNFLGTDFIEAPASTKSEFHNSFKGGLVAHLLTVTKYAVEFNKALPENERVDNNSLIKVCFLHQIGKARLYVPITSEWHLNKGINYDFSKDLLPMKVSERSVYYAVSNGITLTEEEMGAILMFDKVNDKQTYCYNSTLGDLLKMASVFAIKNEEKNT